VAGSGLDDVNDNMRRWADRRKAAIVALGQTWAAELEGRAKQNAPWTDRTGNARNGLFGQVVVSRDDAVIMLAHSMDYGVWLELCNDGRYAILLPTMNNAIPRIVRSYRSLWEE